MGLPSSDEVIVVVDDDEYVRRLFSETLRVLGYTVLTASDGEDAIRVMSEHDAPVHLVVADVNMPRMDGLEFVELVQSAYPGVPALLISGEGAQYLMDNHDRIPRGTHFLAKPVAAGALASQVRQILDG